MSLPNCANDDSANGLYPPIEPFDEQRLPVSPPHQIHVSQSGNPAGVPVLFLHGGPGSQTRPEHRRYFDPRFYRAVLFDQRGCGRSTPAGCIEENTTWHLVQDMEAIRLALGVDQWLLFGGSWGSALALAYAITHPRRVAGMILRGVFLASRGEVDWYVNGLRRFVPAAWEQLAGGATGGLIAAYHKEVNHPDPAIARAAARRWAQYEQQVMAIGGPCVPSSGATANDQALLAPARVQLHYLAAECFLHDGQLMEGVGTIAAPTIIVQGRNDMVCPPVTAYQLNERLPASRLRIIEQAGHAASGPRLAPALRRAADDMRELVSGAP
ncbi:MAG: prolyl aminopeptidase [Burkholderiales bacterium]